MSFKVKFFLLEHKWNNQEKIGPIIKKEGKFDTRLIIKSKDSSIVDWAFFQYFSYN